MILWGTKNTRIYIVISAVIGGKVMGCVQRLMKRGSVPVMMGGKITVQGTIVRIVPEIVNTRTMTDDRHPADKAYDEVLDELKAAEPDENTVEEAVRRMRTRWKRFARASDGYPKTIKTLKADDRGRVNLGIDYAGAEVRVAVLEVGGE